MGDDFKAEPFPVEPVPPRLERAWALSAESVLDAATAGVREGDYPAGSVVCFGTATIYIEGRHRPIEVYTQWLEVPRKARYVLAAADNHELLEAIGDGLVKAEVRFSDPYVRIPADPWDLLGSEPPDSTKTFEQVEKEARETYEVPIQRRTLRYYQTLGLIPPPLRVKGHMQRRYADDMPARILAIRRLLAEGHTLEAIGGGIRTGVTPRIADQSGSRGQAPMSKPTAVTKRGGPT